jgi:hypothetical protein
MSLHGSEDSYCGFLLYATVLEAGDRVPLFRKNTLPPYSTLKVETVCSSETLVPNRQATALYHNSDDHKEKYYS